MRLSHRYIRRCLAWLDLPGLAAALACSRVFRYATFQPLVILMHANGVETRCRAAALARQAVTDQNSAQDLMGCNLLIAMMLMLQEGRAAETYRASGDDAAAALAIVVAGRRLRDCAVRTLLHFHRFRPRRGKGDDDPVARPIGSSSDISDTAESELLDECLRLAGLDPRNMRPGSIPSVDDIEIKHPCFSVVSHTPAQLAPAVAGFGVHGRPPVTVIERADSHRRLMHLGTFYLEGFCESEAGRGKLGHELLFWYAKAVIAALAGAGVLRCNPDLAAAAPAKCHQQQRRVLVLGLGAGVLPACLQCNFPEVDCDVCEIHEGVVHAAREGFGLNDLCGERLTVQVANCLHLVRGMVAQGREYDAVVCDVYGDGGMPRRLCDVDFVCNLRKLVQARRGSVVVNCGNEMELFDLLRNNFRWAFKRCTITEFGHPDEENHLLTASMGDAGSMLPSSHEWKHRVERTVPSHLFQLFLAQQVRDGLFFVTFLDAAGICAADSLSVGARKLQYANEEKDFEPQNEEQQEEEEEEEEDDDDDDQEEEDKEEHENGGRSYGASGKK